MTTEAEVVADLAKKSEAPKTVSVVAHGDRHWLVKPPGLEIVEVTDPHGLKPAPARVRQRPLFYEREAFVEYLQRFKSAASVVFNNVDGNTFDAFLDYHQDATKAGTGEHVARLELRYSEEFARWNAIVGKWLTQTDFAEFLEENYVDIKRPTGAEVLELACDLEAKKDVKWKSAVRRDTETRVFSYEEDLQANQKGKGEVVVPRDLLFGIPIYAGEKPYELTAFLRHQFNEGGLKFKLDWYRVEFVKQAVQRDVAFQVRENCGVPVFVGVPTGKH